MKTEINLILILILTLSLGSCSKENDQKLENEIFEVKQLEKTPDFRAFLFGGQDSDTKVNLGFFIETESDLVSASGGCYTVNVRVYMTSTVNGQRYLVASDNAVICEESAKSNLTSFNKSSDNCNGKLKDGNYIIENNTTEHICLFEILTKNIEAYDQYKESVSKLIASL